MTRRLPHRLLVITCATIAIAATVAVVRGRYRFASLTWTWTSPFDEAGGSGFREHRLTFRFDSRIGVSHSANWRATPSPSRLAGSFDWPAVGVERAFTVRSTRHPSGHDWDALVPTWLLLLPGLVPPAAWWDRRRARVRATRLHRAGRCPACAYDLRASKDRCPECGRPISSA